MPAERSIPPTIVAIVADAKDPNVRRVRVGRRCVAELLVDDVAALKLAPGKPWTPALEARVARVQARADARRDALRMLARAGVASSRLRERLQRKGHEPTIAAEVVAALAGDGWLSDEAFAEAAATSMQRRGALPKSTIAARLASRGVDESTAERVADRKGATDDLAACLAAATKLSRSTAGARRAAGSAAQAEVRRTAAALARRGFDPDTIETTLRRLGLDLEARE